MELIVLIFLIIGITSVSLSWAKSNSKCPPPKVVYRYIPEIPLDTQFGDNNQPSVVYKEIFLEGSPWIGGFKLGNKALKSQDTKK